MNVQGGKGRFVAMCSVQGLSVRGKKYSILSFLIIFAQRNANVLSLNRFRTIKEGSQTTSGHGDVS